MSGFVLDASITLTWLLDDESHEQAEIALNALAANGAIVPQLWHGEVRNGLIVAVRRKRLSYDESLSRLDALNDLPVHTDDAPDFQRAYDMARKYDLSYYDALYLELAARLKLPLASLDKQLVGAASAKGGEGLPLL